MLSSAASTCNSTLDHTPTTHARRMGGINRCRCVAQLQLPMVSMYTSCMLKSAPLSLHLRVTDSIPATDCYLDGGSTEQRLALKQLQSVTYGYKCGWSRMLRRR